MKICSGRHGCGEEKPLTEFYKNGNLYMNTCKVCTLKFTKNKRQNQSKKEKIKFIKVNRDLVDVKIGLLTAVKKIRKTDKHGSNRWYWECLCDCGKNTVIREDFFLSGKTKSCGCFGSRNSIHKINQKSPGESAINSYYCSYINGAKRRKLEFKITKDDFKSIISENCFYCGDPPLELYHNAKAHGVAYGNGIDRVNNKMGYTIINCVACCKFCNIAKSTLMPEQFYEKIIKIYNNKKLGQ